MTKVTDPALLAQLNGPTKVTDPALLAQLNGDASPAPSLGDKISADADKRSKNIVDTVYDPTATIPEKVLRTSGEGMGFLANDLPGNVIGRAIPGMVKRGAKAGEQYVADSAVGRGIGAVARKGEELSQAHPGTAKDVEAVLNIAAAAPVAKGAKLLAGAAEDVGKAAVKVGVPKLGESGAGAGIAKTVPAKTVDPEIAKIVKSAEKAGIKVPTAGLLPKGGVLAEHANVSGMKEYTASVNRKAADLIGANDAGGEHAVINEASLIEANKNLSKAYDKVAKEIGNIKTGRLSEDEQQAYKLYGQKAPEAYPGSPYAKIQDIVSKVHPSDRPGWNRIAADLKSDIDADGNLSASNLKKIISYDSDLAKKARSTANDAGEAQKVINVLKETLYKAAGKTQKPILQDLDNKYKLMIAFDKSGTRVGAGQTLTPEKIRDVIDAAYKESGENQYPARELKTLLDTLHPPTGTESSIQGLTKPKLTSGTRNPLNPLHGTLTGRLLEKVPSVVSSKIVDSPAYRAKLLGDEGAAQALTKVGP